MWEIISTIINYLLQNGGIYGVFIIILVAYIAFREWKSLRMEKKPESASISAESPPPTPMPTLDSDTINNFNKLKDLVLILERQQNQTKILEENTEILNGLSKNLAIIKDEISGIDKNQNLRIDELNKILNSTNKERLEDLREILLEYNKVVNDLNLILKSDFSIKRRN